jgi:hypothetical protein
MSDPQAIADRFQIEALRGEFTDAAMMRDWDPLCVAVHPPGEYRGLPPTGKSVTTRSI